MRSSISRLKRLPFPAKALTAGAVLGALLTLARPAPGRRSPARAYPLSERSAAAPGPGAPPPEAGPPELTSLCLGPGPMVFAPGRHVAATFITDDESTCHLVAAAQPAAGAGPVLIHWSVDPPAGFQAPPNEGWTGSRLDVVLHRPGGNPGGLGGPLAFTVEARVSINGQIRAVRETVVQDQIDQLRQEYIDLQRRRVPDRSEFMNEATFAARYGRRYPWLHFADLNWSVNPSTGLRYSYAILRPELLEGLDQVRRAYGSVVINSGYRNPVHQVEVHAPVRESLHQYGYAADLAVIPGPGRALPNEVDWRRLAEAACTARAKWVEPLDSSAPNSPGCHVHLDYRPGPASSAPVRLRGQVVEAKTGRPVAGALVLLGAMPARTDANGVFGIRTVLSGGPYPVEVRAAGFEALTQPVPLVAWGSTRARLALQAAPRQSFVVEVARTHWVDQRSRLLAATLRITHTAPVEADEVRLTLTPVRATVVSQEPADLGAVPAAAVRGLRVLLRLPRVPAPERLTVTLAYLGALGVSESTSRELMIVPPGVPGLRVGFRVANRPPARLLPAAPARHAGRPVGTASPPPTHPAAPAVPKPVGPAANAPKLLTPAGSAASPAKAPDSAGDANSAAQKPAAPPPAPNPPPAAPGASPSAAPASDPKPAAIPPPAGSTPPSVSTPSASPQ